MKIYKGKKSITVSENTIIIIQADAPFSAYAIQDEDVKMLLGPFVEGVKMIKAKIPAGTTEVLVKTSTNTTWQLEEQHIPVKVENNIPIAVETERPLTMKEEISRYFSDFANMIEEKSTPHEKPSDIFDFSDDEDDTFRTPFTINDDGITLEEEQELKRLLAATEIPPGNIPPGEKTTQKGKQEVSQERQATDQPTQEKTALEKTNTVIQPPQPAS